MSQIRPIASSILQVVACLTALGAAPALAQTIPVARADVDRDCTVTRADATIVQGLMGRRSGQVGFNRTPTSTATA